LKRPPSLCGTLAAAGVDARCWLDDLGQTDRPDAEAALREALEELAARTLCSIVMAGNNPALQLEGFNGSDLAPWSDSQIQTLIAHWQPGPSGSHRG
jgi:hypothetical protein